MTSHSTERRGNSRRDEDRWAQWLASEASEVLSVIDGAGALSYISPAAERLFGWNLKDLHGQPAARLYHPDDLRLLGGRTRPQERRRHVRLRCRHRDGMWRDTAAQVRPMIRLGETEGAADGVGMVIVSRDVTDDLAARRDLRNQAAAVEARRAELEQRAQADDARPLDADQLKRQFLRTISHELRTPITAILGFADVLGARGLSQEHPELEIIERNGRRLLEMVNDMIVLAELEAGELFLDLRPVDIIPMVKRVVESLRPAAEAKGLGLEFVSGDSAVALADQAALQVAVRHLVDNAVKFSDDGEVRVTVEAAGDRVRLAVQDPGPGVPPAVREAVFAPFTQADQTTSRRHGGAGIGLALVRRLVESQRGLLGLDDRNGGGTVFWVQLPAGPQPA